MVIDKEKLIALIFGVFIMSILFGCLIFAWQEPNFPPPQGNVPAPLNVSLNPQAKEGSLLIATNPSILTATNTAGLIVQYGNVGIGTTTPSAKLSINVTNTTTTPFQIEAPAGYDPNLMPNWNYRRSITISNLGSALTDYQISITLDTASLISAGKMRTDCGDIRFTDSDGRTLLNYWIESGCNSSNTKIWVKVPQIPANLTKTIYLYYGNPNATSQSNPTNVFIFFDDAEIDYGNWELVQGRWHRDRAWAVWGCGYQGAYTWVYCYDCGYYCWGYYDYTYNQWYYLQSRSFNLPSGTRMEFYTRGNISETYTRFIFQISYDGGKSWNTLLDRNRSWDWERSLFYPSSSSNTKIRFGFTSSTNNIGGVGFDMLIIRKYTYPEPFVWLGGEEKPLQQQTTFFIQPSTGNIGIGTTNPTAKLEIAGQIKITGGSPGPGKVLVSDHSGLASWGNVKLNCTIRSKSQSGTESTVLCEPDEYVISGGCNFYPGNPCQQPYTEGLLQDYPVENGWYCKGVATCWFSSMTAYAICCKYKD